MRCSQRDHPVTGRVGSVHPIGQPMSQSEKFGLKVRSLIKDLGPAFKLMWSGCEKRKEKGFSGRAPQAVISIHMWVQARVTLPRAICLPVCVGSLRNFIPSADSSISVRFV